MGFSRIVGFEAVVKVLKVLWDSLGSSELWGGSAGFSWILWDFFGIFLGISGAHLMFVTSFNGISFKVRGILMFFLGS